MKQIHTRRDKGRALFLAALMVLSVFAMSVSFAGAAAAAATGVSLSSETVNTNDDPAETDITVTADASYSNYAYAIVDDSNTVVASGDVALDTAANSHTFTSVDVSGLDEGDYTVYAEAGADVSAPAEGEDVGDFGDDGATAALSLIAQVTVDNLGAQDDFYQGQQIEVTGFTGGETVELHEGTSADGEPVEYLRADSDGTVTIDTTELNESPYVLDNGTEHGPFWVVVQDASVEFDSDTVAQTNTSLTYQSENRDEAVDLEISSANHTGEELAQIFNADETNDDSIVVNDVSPGESLDADFSDVETGEYNFTASVADSTAEDDASIEVTEAVEANAQFDASVYSEEIGDVAEMTVEMEGTDTATVNMTDDSGEYNLEFDVVDNDGDGEVTVQFNTYLAGQNNNDVVQAAGEDDVIVDANADETELQGFNLQPSDLDLELYVNGEETDVATLGLNERSTGDAWTGVAPDGADLNTVEEINNATSDGSEVAEGDSLIVKVDVSGIFGFLGDDAESNIGANDEDITFNLEQTNPDRYQNPEQFSLGDEGVSVVSDSDNNALYFVIDTSANANIEAGQEYDATFSVNDSYAYADGESSETSFSVVERTNELTGEFDEEDRLQVGNDAEATISGESTAAPGTDVQVRLRATGEDPFLMSQTVQVQEDGTFDATFDLSDNQVGQEFSISVTDMEEDANGIIVESGPAPHSVVIHVEDADGNAVSGAEITVGDQSATTDDDGKATLELAHGEYKVNASYDGVEANGKLTVDDQTPDEVTLTLGEEDVDYNEKANEDEQKDEEQKDEKQSDEKQSDEKQNDENNDDEQPGSGADEQPGFGIAVALVALLAAAGIALRRQ